MSKRSAGSAAPAGGRALLAVGLAALALIVSPAGAASPPAAPAMRADVYAFVGVNVIPMDRERVLEDQTVIVEDGRIIRIGPADQVEVPAGAERIDGAGRYLIPGLGEMHAHVPPEGTRAQMERVLFLYLSNGVTTARGMLGQPAHLTLRADIEAGDVLSPRLYTSGPSLNGNSIPSVDSAEAAVRHQKAAGYDFMKIHPGLTRDEYDAIAAVGSELGLKWAGHVPADVGLRRALQVGQASVDHLDQYVEAILRDGVEPIPGFFGLAVVGQVDESKIQDVARATAEAGVWNVPTQSLIVKMALPDDPEQMARRPEMRYVSQQQVEQWVGSKRNIIENAAYDPEMARRLVDVRRKLIKALNDAGAGMLLGSDAPQVFQVPGFSIHDELRGVVDSGVSEYDALVMGTVNVARYFDALDEFGTVEEGKVADLVLLEANPLADIANVADRAGVMVRGRWLGEAEIQERLEMIAAEYAGESSENR